MGGERGRENGQRGGGGYGTNGTDGTYRTDGRGPIGPIGGEIKFCVGVVDFLTFPLSHAGYTFSLFHLLTATPKRRSLEAFGRTSVGFRRMPGSFTKIG